MPHDEKSSQDLWPNYTISNVHVLQPLYKRVWYNFEIGPVIVPVVSEKIKMWKANKKDAILIWAGNLKMTWHPN